MLSGPFKMTNRFFGHFMAWNPFINHTLFPANYFSFHALFLKVGSKVLLGSGTVHIFGAFHLYDFWPFLIWPKTLLKYATCNIFNGSLHLLCGLLKMYGQKRHSSHCFWLYITLLVFIPFFKVGYKVTHVLLKNTFMPLF